MRAFWKWKWNWKLRTFVVASAFTVCTLPAGSVQAQFREIVPNRPGSVVDVESLQPTDQKFVAPVIPATENESSEPSVKDSGVTGAEKTPLAPPASDVRQPTPATAPQAKQESKVKISEEKKEKEEKSKANSSAAKTTTAPTAKTGEKQPANDDKVAVKTEQPAIERENLATFDPFSLFASPAGQLEAPSPDDVTLKPLVFNGIEPGNVTVAELRQLWGAPAKIVEVDGAEKMIYKAPGFRQIDVVTDGSHADDSKLHVQSIVVHLEQPQDAIDLSSTIGLADVIPVLVEDEQGQPLGVAFPERGVLFGMADNRQSVATISIEPISGELFRLRAENDELNNYTQSLADLKTAVRLNDDDAHAYWLMAELFSRIGDPQKAYEAAIAAANRSDEPLYRLTKARLFAEQGNAARAKREIGSIATDESVAKIVRARAFYELGNLKAMGMDADFEQAIADHLKAIELSAPYANDTAAKVRRMSKDILVDAHLAVAQDIALGNFQRQEEVVPKWLIRATELAENFLKKDRGDDTLRLEIYRATLAAYSVLPGNFDASVAAEEALTEGKRLIGQSVDELYQRQVQRELIETLFYAARIEHQHGRFKSAAAYADNAISLIKLQGETANRFDRYVAAQLYFLRGSLHAIHEQNHEEAVAWYHKALPILQDESLESLVSRSAFGELFVSMGVSFWETGEKDTALKLTTTGTELLQKAVQEGIVDLEALSVPYGNLATMHAKMGNTSDAKHYSEMMARISQETSRR